MNLYGEKVLLRAMEPEDMEMFRDMINDPEIERMVGGWSFPVSRTSQMKWYERVDGDRNNLRFTIQLQDSGQAVGMISLTGIDWKNREGVYGIKLCSKAPKRQGIARDAVWAMMQYAFEELQLHRLTGEVLSYNAASAALWEGCGSKREGLKRQAIFKGGTYHDVIYYGVLYEDFLDAVTRFGWKTYGQDRDRQ